MGQGVARITPGDLLNLLVKQLSEAGVPSGSNIAGAGLSDRAFLTLWPDELLAKNPKAKQFVAVRPNRMPVWQTVIQGAGAPVTFGYAGENTMTGHNAVVSLVCFAQINPDVDMGSKQELTEQTLGVISFVQKVIAAVQFWNPFVVGTPNTYLREPARMTDAGFGLEPKKIGDTYWAKAPLDLELKFTAKYPSTPT